MGTQTTLPNTFAEVQRLLSLSKCKQAVELAKDHHKRVGTDESRRLLVKAYAARIEQFQNTGMPKEAQTLLEMVRQRFPEDRAQFEVSDILSAAVSGRFADLLRPLSSPQVLPEIRDRIEQVIAQKVTDLPALAACDVLPTEHPLRRGAAVVWDAFLAVTSGPVDAEKLELLEISRRSPYAGWKMAIRAIALFYQSDEPGCRRALDAIPAESAVAPVVLAVRGLVDGKKPTAGIAGAIFTRVRVDDKPLRSVLKEIDYSFEAVDMSNLIQAIREAMHACKASRPELLNRLRVRIFTKALALGVPLAQIEKTTGIVKKDASFWKQVALAIEPNDSTAQTATAWERFLRHGVHEGLFTQNSPEAAAIWMRIANVLSSMSFKNLLTEVDHVGRFNLISGQYDGQPADIAALRPQSDKVAAEQYLSPGIAFRQAAQINGDAETFEQWWTWAQSIDLPEKQKNDLAIFWSQRRPKDVQPLLHLTMLAEKRNALSMAIKFLAQAESVDPMNSRVRHARVRLTLAIAWRHFGDGKAHLVEKDLTDLAALPGMQEGDRSAVLESMRAVWHRLRKDAAAESAAHQIVLDRMGLLAGEVIYRSIEESAKHVSADTPMALHAVPAPLEAAYAMARVIRLGSDLELSVFVPTRWRSPIHSALRERPAPISTPDLLSIAKGAILIGEHEMAYLATAAALSRSEPPAITARFLLLRAKSLTKYIMSARRTQCLRAALDLARQAHDEDLIREVFATLDSNRNLHWAMRSGPPAQALEPDVFRKIVENERAAQEMPKRSVEDPHVVDLTVGEFTSEAEAFFDDDDDEVDDWDELGLFGDDDDDDEAGHRFAGKMPDQITPEILRTVVELMMNKGLSSAEEAKTNPAAVVDAMCEAMGIRPDQATKRNMVDNILKSLAPPNSSGGRDDSRSHKKKKRGR